MHRRLCSSMLAIGSRASRSAVLRRPLTTIHPDVVASNRAVASRRRRHIVQSLQEMRACYPLEMTHRVEEGDVEALTYVNVVAYHKCFDRVRTHAFEALAAACPPSIAPVVAQTWCAARAHARAAAARGAPRPP
jgi:hypothetical protein